MTRLNLIAYGIISQLLEKWSDIKLMILRSWQQKIIDEYPSIIKQNKRFILKAPTGAGKTILASEIVERFYKEKKILVLCHRLVLLEQLERALSKRHKVRKLSLSESGPAFNDYDILLSTNMRAKEVLEEAIRLADLIIVDEAHRVSPNGSGYKKILDDFENYGKPDAQFMGLTASPERRTGDQRDQLNLAFDAIICLLYTSPSPRDRTRSRMPSSA